MYTFKCSIEGRYNNDKLKKDLTYALKYYDEWDLGKNLLSQTVNVNNNNNITIKVNLEDDKTEVVLHRTFKKIIKILNDKKNYSIKIINKKKKYTFKCSIEGKYNNNKLKRDLIYALKYYDEWNFGKNLLSQTVNVNNNNITIKVNLEDGIAEVVLQRTFKKIIKILNDKKSYSIEINKKNSTKKS